MTLRGASSPFFSSTSVLGKALTLQPLHEECAISDDEKPRTPRAGLNNIGAHPKPQASAHSSDNESARGSNRGGTAIRRGIAPDSHSPGGRDYSPQNTAAGYAALELKRVRERIQQARNADELFAVANDAFGPNALSGSFCHAQRDASEEKHFRELQRLMVEAELHDHLNGRATWPVDKMNRLDFRGPTLWQVGHYLRHTRHDHCPHGNRQKKAAEDRDALLKELNALFTQSDHALDPIKAQLRPQTLEHWERYSELAKQHEIQNRGKAGWFLGKVVLDLLPIVATESKTAAFAAKLSRVARQLLKLAHNINTHRNDGAAKGNAIAVGHHLHPQTNTLEQIHS